MKTKLLSLIFLAVLMISCQNDFDKDLTLKIVTSSKLTVKVVDGKGTLLSNVKVKLFDRALLSSSSSSSSYSSLQYIYAASTDANGVVDFGDVASGIYFILIDSVRVNGLNYQPVMQFQINSGVDKNITINPEDYATTFNFSIKKTEVSKTSNVVNVSDFNNLNMIFIPYTSYLSYYSLDQLISLAEIKGKTNDVGFLSLKLPAFKTYIAIAYNDAKTVYSQLGYSQLGYSATTFTGDKGEVVSKSFSLDSKTLQSSFYGKFNVSIKKAVTSPTTTSPTLLAFEGLNAVAIPSSLYDSNLPLSMLLEYAELSGKTDAEGNISFSLKAGVDYRIIVYNDNKTAYCPLYFSSSNSFYINQGETKQSNFTISPINLAPVVYTRISVALSKTSSVYYTPNPIDLVPFSNVNVAIVPYFSNNSGSSIDALLSKAIAGGVTDASGQISFVLPIISTGYSTSYQIVAYDAAKTNKFVSSEISAYSGNSYSKNYYLNATSWASVN